MTRINAPKRVFTTHPRKEAIKEPHRPARPGETHHRPETRHTTHAPKEIVQHKMPAASKNEESLRFIPIGGLEQIGQNCSMYEFKDEIVMVDAGIQFPEETTPGIDYIIPNVSYIEPKKRNVRGIILTHGHLDHVHALPHIIEKIGNPVIYTTALTKALVEKRFQEFPNVSKPKFQVITDGERVRISNHFTAEFFLIDHAIPDSIGFILETPVGKMVNFGDFRVDHDVDGNPINTEIFERLGTMDIHTVYLDSTNADIEGHSVPEKLVEKNLEMLFKKADGRIIVAIFASLLTRLGEIIKIAEKLGRKVAINGRAMKDNVQIAKDLGYMKFKEGHVIAIEEINRHKDNKILILSTGGQGEPNSGLTRIANGEHKIIRLKRSDTVIFSSSVIPGNERSVQMLQDNISRQADEIYNYKMLDIHASGHCAKEDLRLVLKMVKPRFVLPIHGYYFKRASACKVAHEVGIPKENTIMMDNGQVGEITKDSFKVIAERVPSNFVMVDGLGVGDVQEVVLRDRMMLAAEGMVVIITTIDRRTGKLLKTPDIISRGFIYLKDNKELLDGMRIKVKSLLERIPRTAEPDPDYVKGLMRDQIGQFLYTKTKRRPMVLPVLIEL